MISQFACTCRWLFNVSQYLLNIVFLCRKRTRPTREASFGRPLPSLQQTGATGGQRIRFTARQIQHDPTTDHRCGRKLILFIFLRDYIHIATKQTLQNISGVHFDIQG